MTTMLEMRQIDAIVNEDRLILEKMSQGDKQAFNFLFRKYWEKGFSDAYKRLKNEEDAKDIVQEIFIKIWQNRETQNIENFPAYLHVAVRNNVIKFISSQKPLHPFFDVTDNIGDKSLTADSNLLWQEFLQSYENFLKSMPPKRQQIFRLRYQENRTTKEISLQMNVTRKTVQNQLGKAIESLKVALHIIVLVGIILLIDNF